MKRTKFSERLLPNYTHGEELFHMISHIVGGGFGVVALVLCVVFSAIYNDAALCTVYSICLSFWAAYCSFCASSFTSYCEKIVTLKKEGDDFFTRKSSESRYDFRDVLCFRYLLHIA